MVLDDAVVNEQARAGYALADGGHLEIRAGRTTLAVLGFGSPAYYPPDAGKVRAYTLTPEPSASETGTADNYVAIAADGRLLWTGTVGAKGSGADMELSSTAIQRGSRVELDDGPHMTVPKGKE